MPRFTTKRFNGKKPRIHGEKDDASAAITFMQGASSSSIVEVIPHTDEDADWVRVRWQKVVAGPLTVGWMRRGHVDAPADPLTVAPVPVMEHMSRPARDRNSQPRQVATRRTPSWPTI